MVIVGIACYGSRYNLLLCVEAFFSKFSFISFRKGKYRLSIRKCLILGSGHLGLDHPRC